MYDSAKASSTADTVSGYANKAVGNIKQGVGRAVGSAKLEAEGHAQEAKGDIQKSSGEIKRSVGR
ncbi:MAG: CsbD family protein [Hyphomicrobiaceae bacterium]|nr:CsbD family protein [Hyphomicrobiaceae bacterium]